MHEEYFEKVPIGNEEMGNTVVFIFQYYYDCFDYGTCHWVYAAMAAYFLKHSEPAQGAQDTI